MTAFLLRQVGLADGTSTDVAIRGGRLVDPADLTAEARTIEAAGLIVLPALVDLHTHLRQPGREDAETIRTGTLAAARGGYTACFAMPNTDPVTDTAAAAGRLVTVARREASAEVIPVGAMTRSLAGVELADIRLMNAAIGVSVFSDDGRCVQDAKVMRSVCRAVRLCDGVVAQHSQDDNLADARACCHESEYSARLGLPPWPAVAESVIVARDVQLAQDTGVRLHVCHVSTAESVEILRWAKARGIRVTAEVTPHHLLLGTSELESLDTTYKVNPPLRTDEHIEALRAALADGTIDVVATDHAPHTAADKDLPFDQARPGMIGLEQSLGVVLETLLNPGRIDWPTLVERMSHAPARIGRIAARQGRPLAIGEPAHLVLVDPTRRAVVDPAASASKARNNPYAGRQLPDPVVMTWWQGRLTYDGLA
jgi:dihydroorotase